MRSGDIGRMRATSLPMSRPCSNTPPSTRANRDISSSRTSIACANAATTIARSWRSTKSAATSTMSTDLLNGLGVTLQGNVIGYYVGAGRRKAPRHGLRLPAPDRQPPMISRFRRATKSRSSSSTAGSMAGCSYSDNIRFHKRLARSSAVSRPCSTQVSYLRVSDRMGW